MTRWLQRTLLVGLIVVIPTVGVAEEPVSVTYGPRAPRAEGDPDYRDVILLSVPDAATEPVHLRVFDADTGGRHDLVYRQAWDTTVRYTLAAGDSGRILAQRTIGEDSALDDTWATLASVMPQDGEHIGDRYVFRLEVQGMTGDDANALAATLSRRAARDAAPDGLLVTDATPTLRILDQRRVTEVPFDLPSTATGITIRNFDVASGRVAFASPWRTVELAASGQDEWRESTVTLLPEERGGPASILVGGGTEIPNDLSLTVSDDAGVPIPLRLPARPVVANTRPQPVALQAALADCTALAFDASGSTDPDGDPLRYRWEFGDGSGSDEVVAVHRYPAPGSYRGRLTVRDGSGQVGDGASIGFDVVVKRPPTAVAGPDLVVPPGADVAFDGTGSAPGDRPIVRYGWDFQDGTRSSGASTTHRFTRSGRYLVTLRVEDDRPGACDASTDQRVVDVNAPPFAVPGPERRVSVGETVRLDGRQSYDVDGEVTAWAWDMGDGAAADGPTAQHAYASPGTYTVSLTVRDDANLANSSASAVTRIIVNDPPVAEAGSDRRVAVGEVVALDGRGSIDRDGRLIDYAWDFGDGARGGGIEPRYAYDRPGTYIVRLEVRDDSGTSTSLGSDQATVTVNAPPVARAGGDQLVTASTVRFDGTASGDFDGGIVRYDWQFGDGGTASGPVVEHVYRAAGSYLARLTVTDDSGTRLSTAGDTTRITVNRPPIADAGPDQIAEPDAELSFSAAGSLDTDGDVTSFEWAFGDGNTASGERVTHRFAAAGTYHVRLKVQDDTGHPGAVGFDEAQVVINDPPVARGGPDVLAAPGQPVILDAARSFDRDGSITAWRWDLGDAREPMLTSAVARTWREPGLYTARLTVTDSSGAANGTAQDEVAIRINHQPVADAGGDIVTSDSSVALDAGGSTDPDGDPLTYRWDFGDGTTGSGARVSHTYGSHGSYPVLLTIDDGTGLANAAATAGLTAVIDAAPLAAAGGNREACAGDVVLFDGSRSRDPDGGLLGYRWSFGDGSTADVVNPTKTWTEGGDYPVTLEVEDDSGLPGSSHVDRVLVRVAESPIAVAGPPQTVCAGREARFDGSASRDADGVVNRFSWSFGDGTSGGGDRPSHVYARPGDYRVALTIDGDPAGQCPSTNVDETRVTVVDAPEPRITAPTAVAAGADVAFDGSASTTAAGTITGWHWEFGDGATAAGSKVEHVYAEPGRYVATLTLSTTGGIPSCSTVAARHAVTVNAAPAAMVTMTGMPGIGRELTFDAKGSHDDDGGITAYAWEFGDGGIASGVAVRHRFETAGRFPVKLTVTDDAAVANSSAEAVIEVVIEAPPEPVIIGSDAVCPGRPVEFRTAGGEPQGGAPEGRHWSFGDGTTANGPVVTHRYAAPGTYDLVLETEAPKDPAYARGRATRPIHVNRAPVAEPGPDRLACPGETVIFDGSRSIDADGRLIGYSWTFGDGTEASGPRAEHRFDGPGSYTVRLEVTDDSGAACASDTRTATVLVLAPPVANAGGDRQGFTGGAHDVLLFDATGSGPVDGQAPRYLWSFGDGAGAAGATVLHGFAAPGTYTVRLEASDGSGFACGVAVDAVNVDIRQRE